jgi:hypothetical protein
MCMWCLLPVEAIPVELLFTPPAVDDDFRTAVLELDDLRAVLVLFCYIHRLSMTIKDDGNDNLPVDDDDLVAVDEDLGPGKCQEKWAHAKTSVVRNIRKRGTRADGRGGKELEPKCSPVDEDDDLRTAVLLLLRPAADEEEEDDWLWVEEEEQCTPPHKRALPVELGVAGTLLRATTWTMTIR